MRKEHVLLGSAGVLTEAATQDILAWVAAGGPGRADMPDGLVAHVIDRKVLPEVDEGGDQAPVIYYFK